VIEDLRARYLPRFITTAQERIRRGLELLAGTDADRGSRLAGELHTLAGEAGLLGLTEIAEHARSGERLAKDWSTGDSPSAMTSLARVLRALSRGVDHLAKTAAQATAPASRSAGAADRVLVVDDSPIIAGQLCESLADAGIEARSADNLAAIVSLVRDFRPRLVLADLNVPGLSADAMCSEIRAAAHPAAISIFIISGAPEAELEARTNSLGADGYVAKASGVSAIIDRVKRELRA
jgi:PleD family two-component response regulator